MLKIDRLLKLLFPKGIYARIILIQLIPIVALQILVLYVFFDKYVDYTSQQQYFSVASELKHISTQLKRSETPKKDLGNFSDFAMNLSIIEKPVVLHSDGFSSIEEFYNIASPLLPKDSIITYDEKAKSATVSIPLEDSFLIAEIHNRRIGNVRAKIFTYWIIASTIFFILLSLLFIRNQIKSILKLSTAAEKMSKGHAIDEFTPSGSHEIRAAGEAILKLQRRINRQVKYRTELLAHISHDLRTPLTRFKLMITQIQNDNELKKSFSEEVKEMEEMIVSYLDFAKGEGNEESVETDLVLLIKATVQKINDERIQVKSDCKECKMLVRPNAIKRALTNVLRNAMSYAKEKIVIKIHKGNNYLYVYCEDDGPGIPLEKRNLVFLPFKSLGKNKGNHGLGLSIVKSIVQGHGGDVTIGESRYKGLKIIIRLPK